MLNNVNPGTALSTVLFDRLTVDSDATLSASGTGIGVFGWNNESITIGPGTPIDSVVNSINDTGVDIEDSGVNITFQRVDVLDPQVPGFEYGIRLVNTNSLGPFRVLGAQQLGTGAVGGGGTIQGAVGGAPDAAGARLINAGQVWFQSMVFLDNDTGILLTDTNVVNDTDAFLRIELTDVIDSNENGLFARNVKRLEIESSRFLDNGDTAGLNRESIHLVYDERFLDPIDEPTTLFSQAEAPGTVRVRGPLGSRHPEFDDRRHVG